MFDPIQMDYAIRQMDREEGVHNFTLFTITMTKHFVSSDRPNFRVTSLRLLDNHLKKTVAQDRVEPSNPETRALSANIVRWCHKRGQGDEYSGHNVEYDASEVAKDSRYNDALASGPYDGYQF